MPIYYWYYIGQPGGAPADVQRGAIHDASAWRRLPTRSTQAAAAGRRLLLWRRGWLWAVEAAAAFQRRRPLSRSSAAQGFAPIRFRTQRTASPSYDFAVLSASARSRGIPNITQSGLWAAAQRPGVSSGAFGLTWQSGGKAPPVPPGSGRRESNVQRACDLRGHLVAGCVRSQDSAVREHLSRAKRHVLQQLPHHGREDLPARRRRRGGLAPVRGEPCPRPGRPSPGLPGD